MTSSIPTIILCGGLGTRLREETEYRPKAMVDIGGRPILWHVMKLYAAHGHTDFILCLGYKGEQIKEYFLNYEAMHSDFTVELGRNQSVVYHHGEIESGWRITLVDTGLKAQTGARVKRAARYVSAERFMLTYTDGVANVDINTLLDFHRRSGRVGTVTGVRPSSRFGELLTDGSQVVQFSEKPQTHAGLINGGFFVLDAKQVWDYVGKNPQTIFEREPLRRLAADRQLVAFPHTGFWQPMDTAREYLLLNELWASGKAPWKTW